MLLAVLDLMDVGEIVRNRIEWNDDLRERFAKIFEVVRSSNDQVTPENPFFHLKSEGFWRHVGKVGKSSVALRALADRLRNRFGNLCYGVGWTDLEIYPTGECVFVDSFGVD